MLVATAIAVLANLALVSAQCSPTTTTTPPPPPTGVALHPNGDASKCLDVQGANFADGTPVQMCVFLMSAPLSFSIAPHSSPNLLQPVYAYPSIQLLLLLLLPYFQVLTHSWDCNGTPAQSWKLSRGAGTVKVAANGTNFCLDAGTSRPPSLLPLS